MSPRSRTAIVAAALFVLCAAAPAPGVASALGRAAVYLPRLEFLHVGAIGGPARVRQVVDGQGRQVLLRGVNVDGLVDYYRRDLRNSYPIDPARYSRSACPRDDPSVEGVDLCRRDFAQMRQLGYNAIRLNLSWSLLEPSPGRIDNGYLDRIAQVVGWARGAGIYVILDMHQDAWSKYLFSTSAEHCTSPYKPIQGYDGAPRWASIHTQPVCALSGIRELDPAVEECFAKFFNDARAPDGIGLLEHFSSVVVALARRFHADPTVVGYDLLNEPTFFKVPGTDASVLLPFYAKVIHTVTSKVRGFRQLFFIEPGATRDVSDMSNITVSWSQFSRYRNVVYEPHVYTRTFTPRSFPMDGGYRSAIADAQHLRLPLWIGEFGSDPADDRSVLSVHYVEQDALGLGGSLWLWKENANDVKRTVFWGVYGPPFGSGVPQPERLRLSGRAYPLYTAGDLRSLSYDAQTGRFVMRATAPRVRFGNVTGATVVFLPAAVRGPVRVSGATLLVVRTAGGRVAYVFPRGGDYRVSAR